MFLVAFGITGHYWEGKDVLMLIQAYPDLQGMNIFKSGKEQKFYPLTVQVFF